MQTEAMAELIPPLLDVVPAQISTVLDDFSRYVIAWKLCTTMAARDVTDTLELDTSGNPVVEAA